jgi:serine-type D-Ala-D-Ala endopeptidase (penicillin-binding protein 7)
MHLSILANLISLYSLIVFPFGFNRAIDISNVAGGGEIKFVNQNQQQAPVRKNNKSLGMEITASTAIIIDQSSGAVLWQKNADQLKPIASITKLLTAIVFLEHNPGWETSLKIEAKDYPGSGWRNLFNNEEVTLRDLFNIGLVASDNTAINALVRSTKISREEFVKLMNDKAKSLGMDRTVVYEPIGLDPKNQSTVTDLAKLAKAAFSRPEILKATDQKEYHYIILNSGRSNSAKTTDKLLTSYLHVLAGKTGSLPEAGYCFISLIKGPKNQEVDVVVLGSQDDNSRFQEAKALAQWSFDNFDWPDKTLSKQPINSQESFNY